MDDEGDNTYDAVDIPEMAPYSELRLLVIEACHDEDKRQFEEYLLASGYEPPWLL